MKIKNQFRISIVAFLLMVVIIAASIIVTEQQTAQLNNQESIVGNIETGASNLNYISNNYFLYQDNASIILWQSQHSKMSNFLSSIIVADPQQKVLVQNVKSDLDNLRIVFDGVVLFLENSGRNVSVRSLPEFQTQWSRMVVQIQALSFDSQQLSMALDDRANQLTFTSVILIVALLGLFGAYFVTNYFLQSRNTLKSISKLQDGISIIGSGDLNYSVKAGKGDEIEEISKSVNLMAANLRVITASKSDLEMEISERKRVEEALRESEQLYRTLFDNSEDGFMLLEPLFDMEGSAIDFRFLKINDAYEHQTGAKAADVLGKSARDVVPELEPEIISLSGKVAKTGKSTHSEVYDKYSNKWYDSHYIPFAKGQVGILFRDITGHKNMEKQMQDNERMAAIGQTAGMVGHDIRNPLQAIVGELFLARQMMAEAPKSKNVSEALESINLIQEQVDYINKIVSDLQDYARPLNPEYSIVDLSDLVVNVFDTITVPDKIKINVNMKGSMQLKTDPTFIKRSITNLVNNAVQAMPDGGELGLTAQKKEGSIVVTISDTGQGIPEHVKANLFKPLTTTKSKGQGLGLAVVKRLVEGLNGRVSFESEEGKGTKFTIELPITV